MTTPLGPTDRDSRYCNGKKRQGEGLCTRPAGWGTQHVGIGHCKLHGGSTESHNVAAVREQAVRDVARFAARSDIHPAEALIELVQYQAGVVEFWRAEVETVDGAALTWGVTRRKEGGEDHGVTEEAKPSIVYSMLREASRDLAEYCKAALAAGVNERLVQVAEQQGHQLVAVFVATMGRLGVDVSPGSEAAQVFLEELRRLRGDGFGQLETAGGGS